MTSTDDALLELMRQLDRRGSSDLDSIQKRFLILSTPRSGSGLFADILNRTGKIGECREWLNMRYVSAYGTMRGRSQVNLQEYLAFVMRKTVGQTGIFAVTAHIEQVLHLHKIGFDVLGLNFHHVVYIYRKDKIAQAVSLGKARITDCWSSTTTPKQRCAGKVTWNVVTNALNHLVSSEHFYREKLAGKVQAEYAYENFSQTATSKAYDDVLAALGIEPVTRPDTGMRIQRNEESARIAAEYRDYLLGAY